MKRLLTLFVGCLLTVMAMGQQTVLLNEDFNDNASGVPTGWDNTEGTVSGLNAGWDAYAIGYEGGCVRFDSKNNLPGTTNMLKTPSMSFAQGSKMVLKFKYKKPNGGDFSVLVSTDGGTTYLNVLANDLPLADDWVDKEYDLQGFAGNNDVKIVFKGTSNSGTGDAYIYLDNVVVESAPTCQEPTGLTITGISTTSATLMWTLSYGGKQPGQFIITVTDVTGNIIMQDSTLAVTPQSGAYHTTINNLTANTTYNVTLQGDCDAEYAGFSKTATMTFATICESQALPYTADFNNSAIPLCTTSHNANIYNQMLKLNPTTASDAYIIFPLVNENADNLEIDYRIRQSENEELMYMVGVITDPANIETFVPVYYGTLGNANWNDVRFNTIGQLEAISPVSVCIYFGSGINTSIYIDDVNIHEAPSCFRPENPKVSNVTKNSAIVEWEENGSSNYTITFSTPGDPKTFTTTTSPYTATGLTPNTHYVVTITANCGTDGNSEPSRAIEITTPCDMATSAIFTEGFENGTIPDCWTQGSLTTGNTDNAFEASSTIRHSGSKAMKMKVMADKTRSYLASQALPIPSANTHQVTIWVNRDNNDGQTEEGIKIWESSSDTSVTNATLLGFIPRYYAIAPAEENTGWHKYSFTIPQAGTHYIIIEGVHKNGTEIYFDDMSVELIPNCRPVEDISSITTTTNSATMSWAPNGTENQWIVVYNVINGSTQVAHDSTLVSTPSITVSGLDMGTDYSISGSIYAYCSATDRSEKFTYSRNFSTKCQTKQVPYIEDFEEYVTNNSIQCWDISASTTPTASVASTKCQIFGAYRDASKESDQMVMRLDNDGTMAGIAKAISPVIALNAGTQYRVTFDFKNNMSRTRMTDFISPVLKISTDNGVTFTMLDSLRSNMDSYMEYEKDLSAYAGQNIILAFESEVSNGFGMFLIDNFQVTLKPSCADLRISTINNITARSAQVNINDNDGTAWEISYGARGVQAGMGTTVNVNAGTYNSVITGLSPQTEYDVYVRRNCGTEYGNWSRVPIRFTTSCLATTVPLFDNFESVQSGILQGCYINEAVNNGAVGVFAGSNYNHTIGGFNGIGATLISGSQSVAEVSTRLSLFKYVTLEAGKNYEISLWAKAYMKQNDMLDYNIRFKYGTLIDQANEIAAINVNSVNWTKEKAYFTVPTNGDYFVGFTTESGTNVTYYFMADDYSIREVNCIPPTSAFISALATNTAEISIVGNANKYEVRVSDTEPDANGEISGNIYLDTECTSNIVNLTNLVPNTTYYYTIRSICSDNVSSSEWLDVKTFHTRCGAVSIPYAQDFESETSLGCWSTAGTGTALRVNNMHHSGSSSYKVNGLMLISPQFNVQTLAGNTFSGWVNTSSSCDLSIGVMNDPEDLTSFIEIEKVHVRNNNMWTEFNVPLDLPASSDYDDYRGAQYVVITTEQGVTTYFDQFNFATTPTCAKPKDLIAYNISATTMMVDWTPQGNENQWELFVLATKGGEGVKHTVNSHPYQLTGLNPGTTYKLYLKALCSTQDVSEETVSDPYSTQCGTVTPPFIEDFETHTIDQIPRCWTTGASTTPTQSNYLWGIYSNNSNKMARLDNQWVKAGIAELQTPDITLSAGNQYVLQFDCAHNATCSDLAVEVVEGTQKTLVGSVAPSGIDSEKAPKGFSTYSYDLSAYAGHTIKIAFLATANFQRGSIFLDNVEVREVLSCQDITKVDIKARDISASATIVDSMASHAKWQWAVGEIGFKLSSQQYNITTQRTFQINGLQPETEYELYIKTECSSNDLSNWRITRFTTSGAPAAMPYVCDFSDDEENGKWIINNSETSANIFAIGSAYGAIKSGSKALYISSDGGLTYSYDIDVASSTAAARLFNFENGEYEIEFNWQCTGGMNMYDYARFYLVPADNGVEVPRSGYYYESYYPSDMIPLDGGIVSNVSGGWRMLSTTINMTGRSGYYYLVFTWTNNDSYGSQSPLAINDVSVRKLTCQPIISASVKNVTANTATIRYNKTQRSVPTQWILNTIKSKENPVATGTATTDTTIELTGLQHSTHYYIYIANNCNGNDPSKWVETDFTTACGTNYTYPYTEDFNGTEFPPTCWEASGNGWQRYVPEYDYNDSHTGTGAAMKNSSTLSSPAMHIEASREYSIKFWMKRYTATYMTSDVQLYLSPTRSSSSTGAVLLGTWTTYDKNLLNDAVEEIIVDVPAELATGDYHILFEAHKNYGGLIIDDVEMLQYPACRDFTTTPEIVSISSTAATVRIDKGLKDTIQFAWAPIVNGSATIADSIGSVTTLTDRAYITGLTPGAQYMIFAKGLCIDDNSTAWSNGTTIEMPLSDCFAPVNLRIVGNVTSSTVTLTWGGAPNATTYEYEIFAKGDTTRGTTTIDTVTVTNLTPTKQYNARVRALCIDGSATAWSSISFETTKMLAEVPYVTGFDDALDNNQWEYVQGTPNKFYISTQAGPTTGNNSLYVSQRMAKYAVYSISLPTASNSNTALNISYAHRAAHFEPGNYEVDFDWRCDAYKPGINSNSWEAFGRAFIVSEGLEMTPDAQTYYNAAPANSIEIYPGRMEGQPNWTKQRTIITITKAGNYEIVFGWFGQNTLSRGTQSDIGPAPLAIDNLSITEVTCLPVNSISITKRTNSEVIATVSKSSAADLEYAIVEYEDEDSINVGNIQTTSGSTISMTGLTAKKTYYLYVRQSCSNDDKSFWKHIDFVVPTPSATLPYVCDFENATEADLWMTANGNQVNQFIVGTNDYSSATHAMYISNDGVNYAYSGEPAAVNTTSTCYAYRTFHLEAGSYLWSYDWKGKGETVHVNDYSRVLLVPANKEIRAGSTMSGLSATSIPYDCYQLDNGVMRYQLTWITNEGITEVTEEGDYNLVFYWHNDQTVCENPPLAFDNVSIRKLNCLPTKARCTSSTTTSLTLSFTGHDADAEIEYTVSTVDSHDGVLIRDTLAPGTNSFTINGLSASTNYYIYTHVICDDDESPWICLKARTQCGIISSLPYNMDFEMLEPSNHNNSALDAICWNLMNADSYDTGGNSKYPFINVAEDKLSDTTYVHNGSRGLKVVTCNNNMYMVLPEISEKSNLKLTFMYNPTYNSVFTITTGYMTDINDYSSFVALSNFTPIGHTWREAEEYYPTMPAGARITLRFNGNQNSFIGLDDIRVGKLVDGGTITDTVCYNSPYNENGFNVAANKMTVGVNHLSRIAKAANANVMDTIYYADVLMRQQITNLMFDTICEGVPYVTDLFNIQNPETDQYTIRTTSPSTGCDSIIALNLYVVPSAIDIYDTICYGDVYTFNDSSITTAGTYTMYKAGIRGCYSLTTLHLTVADTVNYISATICADGVYTFEGKNYTEAGTYRIVSTGAHGCQMAKILTLNVLKSDTTYSTNICAGGYLMISDTMITTAGTYHIRRMSRGGCFVTHHVTITVDDPIVTTHDSYGCEGKPIYEYGISGLVIAKDTVVTIQRKTTDAMCDSTSIINLTFVPTAHSTTKMTINMGESVEWNGMSYASSGTYNSIIQTDLGCDSVATLELTVIGETGVDDIETDQIVLYPNPTTGMVYVNTEDEIVVTDITGRVIKRSTEGKVDLTGLASGVYMINEIKVIKQ